MFNRFGTVCGNVAFYFVLCFSSTCLGAAGEIYDLGTVGGPNSGGYGINASGQIAGSAELGGHIHAVRYDGTPESGYVMRDLGDFAVGRGINASGQVTGEMTVPVNVPHAFRYDGTPGSGGVMRDLGTFGGPESFYSHGSGINASGQVAGSALTNDGFSYHAFRYDGTPGSGGVMRDLGTLGGDGSYAYGINDAGQITGQAWTVAGVPHAFLYEGTPGSGGVMHDLGVLGTGTAINASGKIAGTMSVEGGLPGFPGYEDHAFRCDGTPGSGGVIHDLGKLSGTSSSRGAAINSAGAVVGWCPHGFDFDTATLWTPDLTMIDLDAWFDAVNPTLGAQWELNQAHGISDAGLITGSGYYDDGPGGLSDGSRAFVLDASSLVPEPAGLVLLALLTPVTLCRNRRRRTVPSRSDI